MKAYPSIQYWNKGTYGESVYVFEKLDGTQIRVEWSKKRGFFKFGSRGQLIDERHEQWGEAVKLFLETYSDNLPTIFKKKYREIENFVCFAEYYGYNSFAGNHVISEPKQVTLFDISAYKKGMLTPKEFRENFSFDVPTATFYGCFTYNKDFIELIRKSTQPHFPHYNMFCARQKIYEGIVAKWPKKTKGQDLVKMVKVKTNTWLEAVKAQYGEEFLRKELNNDSGLYNEI